MKKLFCLALVALLAVGGAMAQKNTAATSDASVNRGGKRQIEWTTIENASKMKDNTKLYFVDFYTNWCGWCKRMDKDVFTDSTVIKLMSRFYVPVKFNAEGNSEFVWKGTKYVGTPVPPNGRPTLHSFTRSMLGSQLGFPSFVIYSKNQSTLNIIQGYQPAEDLVKILWYFASGDYNKYNYEKYQTIFDKEIRPKMEASLK